MKVFISANSSLKEGSLDPRFGRCEFFQIYNSETNKIESIQNPGFTSGGGAGIKAGNFLIDNNADILITGHLGPNASDVIKGSNIKVYTSPAKKITEVIKDYEDNKLEELKF